MILGASSLKVGESFTSSSVIPCTAVDSAGIGISGFTYHVLLSLEASGKTFKIQISTILSFEILMPVVSKSKIQSGLWSFRFIIELRVTSYGLRVTSWSCEFYLVTRILYLILFKLFLK